MNRAGSKRTRHSVWIVALALLGGCASDPFKGHLPPDLDRAATPLQTVAAPAKAQGRSVLWGGTIVAVHNLADSTEIAVLSYPLDDSSYPQSSKEATGRFIVQYDGFLDPLMYRQGRPVTVLGKVKGVRKGMVGEAPYQYPLVDGTMLHLWKNPPGLMYPRFTFGIGTGISF